ncbi:MAG: nuclear transport factor 2 family protein [Proteobacteria bacterium]|nr:nuclear transport factor 2 family protein [Pseudomonadota bacterium]
MMRTVFSLICVAALAQPATAAPSPHAVAQTLLDAYLSAWDRADAGALGRAYATRGVFINPTGNRFVGPAAVTQFYAAAFARGYAGRTGAAVITSAQSTAPDLMTAEGRWRINAPAPPAASAAPECGVFQMQARHEGRGWKVTLLHETSADCPENG